jgi:hypothetical protein
MEKIMFHKELVIELMTAFGTTKVETTLQTHPCNENRVLPL